MRVFGLATIALLAARGALAADTLTPGPGEEATAAACSGCHTSDYIIMNSLFLTAEAWKAEVTKMRSAFMMVLRRCAMTRRVECICSMARETISCVRLSSALVDRKSVV